MGQAFSFNGTNAYGWVPASPTLDPIGLGGGVTIECWINPADTKAYPLVQWNDSFGQKSGLALCDDGELIANSPGFFQFSTGPGLVQAGVFQHVAFTYDNNSGVACLYWNGVQVQSGSVGGGIAFTSFDLWLGAEPDYYFDGGLNAWVWSVICYSGLMDEVAIYSRALTAAEIQAIYNAGSAGKCPPPPTPPSITSQPASQGAVEGDNVAFAVVATGTAPLSYQWQFNGANISGATGATYSIGGVQTNGAGTYAVTVQNPFGTATSSGAVLTVIPAAWLVQYFGSADLSATNVDGVGNTLLYDFSSGTTPAAFQFTAIATANNYFNAAQVPAQLAVSGWPYWIAILVDDTNFADANWTAYTSSNITVNLGLTEGWHQVLTGLRGHADDPSAAVWQWKRLKLDLTPPAIVITQPANSLVTRPMIQVRGYCPEALASISYDLTNALGLVANQQVLVLNQVYSTNTWEFTTNTFQAFDVPLTNGPNTITIHASDLAGNAATASFTFTLDYSSKTNPPEVALYWPHDQTQVGNGPYTWRGWISDPTASVTAQLVDTNGDTNVFAGLVERDGHFWVENLPLLAGPNYLTLTVTDVVGNVAMTNITVFPGAVALTITAPTPDQLWQQGITVNGTISDATDYTVWVNGVAAAVNGDGTWTASPVYLPRGGTAVLQARAIPNSDNGGNGSGGGGGAVSYGSPGNPSSAQAIDAEVQSNKPSRLFVQSYIACEDLAV